MREIQFFSDVKWEIDKESFSGLETALQWVRNFKFHNIKVSIQLNKNLNYSAEPSRWNEYPNNLYLFYIQFIGGLQSGIIPTFVILKKMNIKEMMYEIYE